MKINVIESKIMIKYNEIYENNNSFTILLDGRTSGKAAGNDSILPL